MTTGVHNHSQNHGSLILGLAGFLGVFRIGFVDCAGRGYAANAGTEHSATVSTTHSGTNAAAGSRTDSATAARTDPSSATGSIRGRTSNDWRLRISQVREIISGQLHLWRHHDRWLDGELGMIVANHHFRRRDLLHRKLGKTSLGSNDLV